MADVGSVKYKVELDNSGLDHDVSKTESTISSKLDAISGKISQSFGYQVLKDIGSAFIDMGKQAVEGFTMITKSALESTASLEQNVGGVETLFKDSADTVIANAKRAYETAGMSANTYMETVTSFSASLLQSLGGDTEEAAKVADMAIIDMSDNANKMGTDIQAIQNAYQGFAKQNYTMLDNLKLGYGGTKTEMERLLKDAEKISGIKYDINNLNDVYQAIHVIQGELDITGTTAKEASTTIEGSMNSAKAAWDNFLNGTTSAEDLSKTLTTAATNIGDNVIKIVQNFSGAIPDLITGVVEGIYPMLEAVVPPILEAVGTLITAIGELLIEHAPDIAFAAFDMIEALFNGMLEATGSEGPGFITEILSWIMGIFEENYVGLAETGMQIIMNLMQGLATGAQEIMYWIPGIFEQALEIFKANFPQMVVAASELVLSLANGIAEMLPTLIPIAVEAILVFVDGLTQPEMINNIIDAALALLTGLVDGLKNALPLLTQYVPTIIINLATTLIENIPKIVECGIELLKALIDGLVETIPQLIAAIPQIISAIWDTIKEVDWLKLGSDLLHAFIDGITKIVPVLWDAVCDLGEMLFDFFGDLPGKAIEWGADMISGFIDGIMDMAGALWDGLCDIGSGIMSFIGFSVPEKGPLHHADEWGPDFMDLFATGIKDNASKVTDAVEDVAGDVAMGFDASIDYDVPDIAGYAKDLTASITGAGSTQIEVPVIIDGREVARASAWYMGEQLAWEAR